MLGMAVKLTIPETEPGLNALLDTMELPVSSDQTAPNLEDIGILPSLSAAGLTGPALLNRVNRLGGFVTLEVVLFNPIAYFRGLLSTNSGGLASERLKSDLGPRFREEALSALPPGLRAPTGGQRGDLLIHSGSSWERLNAQPGSVLTTAPDGSAVWLPLSELGERLSLSEASGDREKRSEAVPSADALELMARSPLVWYRLSDLAAGVERLRPALLHPDPAENGQRLTVFLNSEDRDWIGLTGGSLVCPRVGVEGRDPGEWRRI